MHKKRKNVCGIVEAVLTSFLSSTKRIEHKSRLFVNKSMGKFNCDLGLMTKAWVGSINYQTSRLTGDCSETSGSWISAADCVHGCECWRYQSHRYYRQSCRNQFWNPNCKYCSFMNEFTATFQVFISLFCWQVRMSALSCCSQKAVLCLFLPEKENFQIQKFLRVQPTQVFVAESKKLKRKAKRWLHNKTSKSKKGMRASKIKERRLKLIIYPSDECAGIESECSTTMFKHSVSRNRHRILCSKWGKLPVSISLDFLPRWICTGSFLSWLVLLTNNSKKASVEGKKPILSSDPSRGKYNSSWDSVLSFQSCSENNTQKKTQKTVQLSFPARNKISAQNACSVIRFVCNVGMLVQEENVVSVLIPWLYLDDHCSTAEHVWCIELIVLWSYQVCHKPPKGWGLSEELFCQKCCNIQIKLALKQNMIEFHFKVGHMVVSVYLCHSQVCSSGEAPCLNLPHGDIGTVRGTQKSQDVLSQENLDPWFPNAGNEKATGNRKCKQIRRDWRPWTFLVH